MTPSKFMKTIGMAIFGLSMVTIPASAEDHAHEKNAHKESHADHMLEGYNAVATALFKDDLAAAKKAAGGMVKHDKNSSLAAPAKELSKSSSIDAARKSFQTLSASAIKVAKGNKDWNVMHCSMAFGNKGADWLQKATDKKPNNPYFGAKMPHCGSLVK